MCWQKDVSQEVTKLEDEMKLVVRNRKDDYTYSMPTSETDSSDVRLDQLHPYDSSVGESLERRIHWAPKLFVFQSTEK